jgi:glyoxylate reductase
MISTDSPIELHGDALQLTSPTGSRPKILVTRRQFQDQIDRLNEVSDALVLDRPAPATPDELQAAATGVHGSTLGIVGFGRIGSAVARRALGSGMNVIYMTRSQPEDDLGCERVSTLNELLERSDFVTLHCPLTQETNGLIGTEELKRMKPEASLINTARGPIVNTDALTAALRDGEIAYAALDVTDPEPIPTDHPLLRMENVTLVPHIASATIGARRKMSEMTVDNILATICGKLPPNCVNADRINWG